NLRSCAAPWSSPVSTPRPSGWRTCYQGLLYSECAISRPAFGRPQSADSCLRRPPMPRQPALAVLLAAALALPAPAARPAAPPPPPPTTPASLAAPPPAAVRPPHPAHPLPLARVARRVGIELAPAVAPQHAEIIRLLARGGFCNGAAIDRSHDNVV